MNFAKYYCSCLAAMLAAISLFGFVLSEQPAYQVSIYIRFHPRSPPIQLCNGAIIQSHLILTSASCLHYQFGEGADVLPIPAKLLSIVVGNGNAYDGHILKMGVSSMEFAKNFNLTTLENDLALMRLERALPLADRKDMQWIILDDDEYKDHTCMASFNVRNSLDSSPDYTQIAEVDISPIKECVGNATSTRSRDLCSQYILPEGFECDAFESFIPYNGDRGTGLVCNSRLVAVLSTILPLAGNLEIDCSEKSVNALYTNVGPYLDWIYNHIADEELEDIMHVDYVASAPYHFETSSIMEQRTTEASIVATDPEFNSPDEEVAEQIPDSAPSTVSAAAADLYLSLHFTWLVLAIILLNLCK